MKDRNLIAEMTIKEKIRYCSGEKFWHTKEIRRLAIPSIQMSDGPHGLRKQSKSQDHLGIAISSKATCFPPACLTACSFDPDLIREMGAAIGREALAQDVQMVLGPGINIKRDPLCGRNFEYFSEDPYLAGEMGKAWIEGLQSTGVGACLKHFACNNQEDRRMCSDSILDERALHEVYLYAFKKALEGNPVALMSAYNRVNGVYMSENRELLDTLLRQKWGFNGLLVTDWGGMSDRSASFTAGLDLEMPGSRGYFDREIRRKIDRGELSLKAVDQCAERVLKTVLSLHGKRQKNASYDPAVHHALARKIAAASAVLLKNEESILPLHKNGKIALVGAMARNLRYQGTGSSHINPHMISELDAGMGAYTIDVLYFEGYRLSGEPDEKLMRAAEEGCRDCDIVVIAAGLTEEYEAEGLDRYDMKMPTVQNLLIQSIAQVNPNVVVVLFGGAPVEMPWIGAVRALLAMYLPGQAGGIAAADILFGSVNPGGKLAESYPKLYEHAPASGFFGTTGKQAQYRESLFVGYRYYDKKDKAVLFPFGFGLSYTSFTLSALQLEKKNLQPGEGLLCSVAVCNTGKVAGSETVQIYVSQPGPGPKKILAGFAKVYLLPGEEKTAEMYLNVSTFERYDAAAGEFIPLCGEYGIFAGTSSRDIFLHGEINLHMKKMRIDETCSAVSDLPQGNSGVDLDSYIAGELTEKAFEVLLGHALPEECCTEKGRFTRNSTLAEMKDSWIVRLLLWYARGIIRKTNGFTQDTHPLFSKMMDVLLHTPVGRMSLLSPDRMPKWIITMLLNIVNGRFWFAREKLNEC